MPVAIYVDKLRDIQKRLPTEKKARTAAMRAINRAMDAGRVQAARQVAKEYAVRQRQVSAKVSTSKASTSNLSSSVTWRGGALNLADFQVNPRQPQPAKRPILRATVSRKSGAQPYKDAFLIRTRSGGVKAFRRTSAARDSGDRYPITGVWGPSIPQLLGARSVRDAVEERAREVLDDRIEHEINRMLEG